MNEIKISIWKSRTQRIPEGYVSKIEEDGKVPYYKHLNSEQEIAGYLLKLYKEHRRMTVLRL
jgi:hypothetical protein